jgi:signal transduction histidine kinase/ActR/RegA family two-component response regulator
MPLVYDAKLLAAENRERDLSVTVGATRESKGELILIGRDVTEQKQVTAMLQQTEKLSSIGEIVAGVAHELNNPLMGVLGYSQLLARKDTEGKFKRDIERILESSNHCRKIVQNLLSFARPSKPDQKQLGLNGVLEKTLDLLEHSLRGDNIEVVKNLAPNLPYVLADFHQIQQVFTNLINNARQAMSTETGQRRLLLRSYVRDASVVVEVTDNGPGIPPEILPRIFDPFFSTKEQGRGTGLGLSISYGIVRDHGGDLLVDSHPRERTTFSVVFPVAKISESETVPDKPAVAAKSVLVVDDEAVLVDLYLELLRALGHAADTASTGQEALRKIEARNYDLVITDIKMPKMNGIQLYEKVLTIRPAMRHHFIFITGSVDAITREQLPILRDIPCLLKPLSINKIEAAICQVLGRPESSADAPVSLN